MFPKKWEQTYPSIQFLQDRIRVYFLKEFGRLPSFPGNQCDLIWHSNPVQDVVLFGDAAYSLMLSHLWPATSAFRLWVLNHSLQRGLTKLFNLDADKIGVIPREALLKRSVAPLAFPNSDVNFVLSMRPKSYKNFPLSFAVVHHLQQHYLGDQLKLHIFSPKATVESLQSHIPKLNWVSKPVIHGDKKENWIQYAPRNPVLLNLSIDPLDDFNVSCAEAQERGWPMILAERGPYQDISGNSTIMIPLNLLRPQQAQNQIDSIALHILSHWNIVTLDTPRALVSSVPRPLCFDELCDLKNKLPRPLQKELKSYPQNEHIWERKIFQIWENL